MQVTSGGQSNQDISENYLRHVKELVKSERQHPDIGHPIQTHQNIKFLFIGTAKNVSLFCWEAPRS